MRNIASCLRTSSVLLALASVSCAKHGDPPPASAPSVQGPPVTQAPGYGDGTTPTLAASPAQATPAAAPGPLSTPDPFAPPCTADGQCLTARCNVAAKKCAWPCHTDNDCMPGNACIAPMCIPKLQ